MAMIPKHTKIRKCPFCKSEACTWCGSFPEIIPWKGGSLIRCTTNPGNEPGYWPGDAGN